MTNQQRSIKEILTTISRPICFKNLTTIRSKISEDNFEFCLDQLEDETGIRIFFDKPISVARNNTVYSTLDKLQIEALFWSDHDLYQVRDIRIDDSTRVLMLIFESPTMGSIVFAPDSWRLFWSGHFHVECEDGAIEVADFESY